MEKTSYIIVILTGVIGLLLGALLFSGNAISSSDSPDDCQ